MREGNLPMDHELKSDPEAFRSVLRGAKVAEIRRNDRDFRVGDTVTLRETRHSSEDMRLLGHPLLYTGNKLGRQITYVQAGYGLPEGLMVLSFGYDGSVNSPQNVARRKALGAPPDPWVDALISGDFAQMRERGERRSAPTVEEIRSYVEEHRHELAFGGHTHIPSMIAFARWAADRALAAWPFPSDGKGGGIE